MRSAEYKRSFDRCYKKLSSWDQRRVDEAISRFLTLLEKGEIPKGIGLKRLSETLWEIRVDIHLRIGFRMTRNLIEFYLVGDHGTIKDYLKNL